MTPSSVLVVKPSSLGDIVHALPYLGFSRLTAKRMDFTQCEGQVGVRFVGFKRRDTVLL
jgi:hypothetical protein